MKLKKEKLGVMKRYFQSKASLYDLLESLIKNGEVIFLQRLINKYYQDVNDTDVPLEERMTVDELIELKGLARYKFRRGLSERLAILKLEEILVEVIIQDCLADALYDFDGIYMQCIHSRELTMQDCFEDDLQWEVGRAVWLYPKLSRDEFEKVYFKISQEKDWEAMEALFKQNDVMYYSKNCNDIKSCTNLIMFSLAYAHIAYNLFDSFDLDGVIDIETYIDIIMESRITEGLLYGNLITSKVNSFWNDMRSIVPDIVINIYRGDDIDKLIEKLKCYNFDKNLFKEYYKRYV